MLIKRLKVLAIDDNQDNLTTIKAVLWEVLPNSEVLTALTGEVGIKLAREENPDVILLDIIMPGMDGFEVCREIKKDEQLKRIPVLFLTALKTNRTVRIKALDAGAEAFLTKPFDETDLIAQILAMAKIKAGNVMQHQEKERLKTLVAERTREIELELIARRKIEHELLMANERLQKYRILKEKTYDSMIFFDMDDNIIEVNDAAVKTYGYGFEEFLNLKLSDLTHIYKSNKGRINFECKDGYIFETIHFRKNGTFLSVEVSSQVTILGSKKICLYIIRDITERKKREEEIIFLNCHDVLTGLYNRAYFDQERKRLDTEQQLPLSVIIGDINGLKLINDAFGHINGDKLLVEVAKILSSCCREKDILARTGGDEFCILLPQTNSEATLTILNKITKMSEEYKIKSEKESYYTSISLGYATKSVYGDSFDNTIKIAEENMYRRKLLEHKSLHSSILSSIKSTMIEKSHETEEHAERLVELSKVMGKILKLTDEQVNDLELLSTLHDIGKISIDESILSKHEKLTESEWQEIRKHPAAGYRIAHATSELLPIADYILSHHERWDGKGYPQGLVGESIPLLSRIIAVADSYDAMTQDRPYRKAMAKEAAIDEIRKNAGTQFDPEIANLFVDKVLSKI